MTVAGLLLAAGEGRRLGRPKALVEVAGTRLVDTGVRLLADGGCAPVVVVLGAAVTDVPGARVVLNPDWASGMASSLRVGLAALAEEVDAVVIALVDQPLVGAESVRRLREAYRGGAVAAVASYAGRPRNPALLARPVWPEVTALAEGDTGARAWMRAHPDQVTDVPCDGTGSPDDIDTAEDLATLTRPRGSRDRAP
ncbi:MAG: nucleotidyltransferase family protein [Actinomycetes bacterium]